MIKQVGKKCRLDRRYLGKVKSKQKKSKGRKKGSQHRKRRHVKPRIKNTSNASPEQTLQPSGLNDSNSKLSFFFQLGYLYSKQNLQI